MYESKFRGCVDITANEYIERLVNLLPQYVLSTETCPLFIKPNCVAESMVHSASLVELLAVEVEKSLAPFADVDHVCELREATRNLYCLGIYLKNCSMVAKEKGL